jgi:sec-independent protein translocase protein TatA
MGGLSWWHWLIIISAFVLLFGAKKLPDAARGLGRSLRILKSEVSAMQEEDPWSSHSSPGAIADRSNDVPTAGNVRTIP